MSDGPRWDEFCEYLAEKWSPTAFGSVRKWLQNRNLWAEEEYLTTFAYIAGGWSLAVPETMIEHGISSLPAAWEAARDGELATLLNDEYETHSHRRYGQPQRTPDAFVTFHEHVSPTFSDFFEVLQKRVGGKEHPFDIAMDEIARPPSAGGVASFGELGAFDWLEMAVRVHGHEWLAPPALKRRYLTGRHGPKTGFELVFGQSIDDGAGERLKQLETYAREELGMADTALVFEIESCLCNFQKGRSPEPVRTAEIC